MGKSLFFFVAFAVSVFSISCAPSITRSGDYGRITIAFGETATRGRNASAALETGWPGGNLPNFSSVTVKVSAPDMSTVAAGTAGSSGRITVQVPAGTGRLVELVAVPAANSTAPYFAKAYSGSASVDVGEGETKSVTITLALAETKIALCSPAEEKWNWKLAAANSLTEPPSFGDEVSLYFYSDIEYDEHGRLFVSSDNRGIQRFSSLTGTAETLLKLGESPIAGLAYQKSKGRLFYTYGIPEEGGLTLGYVDMQSGEAQDVAIPSSTQRLISVLAADESAIYAGMGGRGGALSAIGATVQKLFVDEKGIATPGPSYSFDALDSLTSLREMGMMLFIEDMVVKDGILYVAVNNMLPLGLLIANSNGEEVSPDNLVMLLASSSELSFGKIIALNAATLSYLGEINWSAPANLSAQTTECYCGPLRFLGFAQGRLYVADAGLQLTFQEGESAPSVNVSAILGRVVEIDTTTMKISRTGPGDSVIPLEWMVEANE